MDAVEYLKALHRMCIKNRDCNTCPIYKCTGEKCLLPYSSDGALGERVKIVDEWAKACPEETRQTRFLKEHPNAQTDWEDVLSVCPRQIDQTVECPVQKRCLEECWVCRRKYWNEEVSE